MAVGLCGFFELEVDGTGGRLLLVREHNFLVCCNGLELDIVLVGLPACYQHEKKTQKGEKSFLYHRLIVDFIGKITLKLPKQQISHQKILILHPNFEEMKQRTLKAALFDLDGVVFDTEPQYTVFWGSICRQYHPEHPGLEHEIKGQTLTQIYDRWFSGDLEGERASVTERLDAYEQQMTYDFIAGFEALIAELRGKGVKTAVVTSSNQPKMESVYRYQPVFKQLFDAILTSEDFERSKPDPDCYLKAAQRLGVQTDECIVFEDSFNGLRSGRSAQMAVVGLATTNPVEAIAPLSDIQITDYLGMDFDMLESLLQK
jgi:HAD superfamily hydrolase (TIGR01509 family)